MNDLNDQPPYESRSSKWDSPTPYTFPTSFAIGTNISVLLVNVGQLKGHLALLDAFYALRTRAEVAEDDATLSDMDTAREAGERRWARFVGFAVERFERWCQAIQHIDLKTFLENDLPPLDVIMVWHAYLLNPGWYAEDIVRVPALRTLGKLDNFFEISMDTICETATTNPSPARIQSWINKTRTPFDPFDANSGLIQKELTCPQCKTRLNAPFITDLGNGYSQQFSMTCTNSTCATIITKGSLGVAKFAKDLVRNDKTPHSCLAGTFRTATSDVDTARAILVKVDVLRSADFSRPKWDSDEEWERNIRNNLKDNLDPLLRITVLVAPFRPMTQQRSSGFNLKRLVSAYSEGRLFAIDLVGAVLRQGSFVKKMHDLKWTDSSFFENKENEVALQHAVARYHGFLDLMASSPDSFFVPTLDIDLAWHTHQLLAQRYRADCKKYIGRFVDHHDKVEENRLSTAFDLTCRAWQKRFKVQYTHCGCPLPEETVGQKLSRVVQTFRQRPPFPQAPDDQVLLAATHPSDHNAVYDFRHKAVSEAARRQREAKVKMLRQKNPEQLNRGKIEGLAHDPAFLLPVPMYCSYPVMRGCAMVTGNVIGSIDGGGCLSHGDCTVTVGSQSFCGPYELQNDPWSM